jgi:predicted nuclease of predicted toxin-antitoxin system
MDEAPVQLENLSPRLVRSLSDVYPGSSHVSLVGLDRASDAEVFDYALDNGYALVSKDVDFAELAQARSPSPKVVWLKALATAPPRRSKRC